MYLIPWLAYMSHNLIPSLGQFRGSITNFGIRKVSTAQTNTHVLCVFISSPCWGWCQAYNVSEVFAKIKVIPSINLVWWVREQYKQQDCCLSGAGTHWVLKQTQAYTNKLGHLGFDFRRLTALRVEACDPVHRILNESLNSWFSPTENQ